MVRKARNVQRGLHDHPVSAAFRGQGQSVSEKFLKLRITLVEDSNLLSRPGTAMAEAKSRKRVRDIIIRKSLFLEVGEIAVKVFSEQTIAFYVRLSISLISEKCFHIQVITTGQTDGP